MLQKLNNTIAYYLDCASLAQERARLSDTREEQEFHERMAERWMDLAASSALAERLDLFIESMSLKNASPADLCNICHRAMRLMTAEITLGHEKFTFKCTVCGSQMVRDLPSYSTQFSEAS